MAALLLYLALTAPPVQPLAAEALEPAGGVRYFVIVFGADRVPKRPKYSHTWATVVKATPDATRPNGYALETQTISWMPSTLNIRVLAVRPECGVNLDLRATITDCQSKCEVIRRWGPYELIGCAGPCLYQRAEWLRGRLASGAVLYKCIEPERTRRADRVKNCIGAVSELVQFRRRLLSIDRIQYGNDASYTLAMVLVNRGEIDRDVTHRWVAEELELVPVPRSPLAP